MEKGIYIYKLGGFDMKICPHCCSEMKWHKDESNNQGFRCVNCGYFEIGGVIPRG